VAATVELGDVVRKVESLVELQYYLLLGYLHQNLILED
jgi:hypothetical protein